MRKQVLITGASRGIGRAIALYLADKYDLVLHYNFSREEAYKTVEKARELGAEVRLLNFDISDRKAVREVLESDINQYGPYYAVVLNAGIAKDAPFPLLSEEDWDGVIHTNLDGFYNVLSPIVMKMVETREHGRIVLISSLSGIVGNRGQVNYSASKAGLIGAAKALAVELAKHKITVNSIAPGLIDTDMIKELPQEEIKKQIPMRRFGTPKEVASLVAYLLSDDAAYITRQVISVNGGLA